VFAAIYIADFSLEALLRNAPDLRATPVALVDPDLPKPAIIQCTAAAKTFGIVDGLTASQALARCSNLEIITRAPTQEASATEILLQTAYAFSPNVEATVPGVCTLELKGLDLGNPLAMKLWCKKILQALGSAGLEARIGVAATPDLALLAAHRPESISIIQDAEDFVADLPISALAPPVEVLEILTRWGVRSTGEFLRLGKTEISERFGPVALELFKRISPRSVRPLKLFSPPELFSEQMEFESEIETLKPLLVWLNRFAGQLSRRLEAIYLVAAKLHLRLGLAAGGPYEHTIDIPSPTGEERVLCRMLQTHLETLRTASPIISLQLSALPTKPEMHQFGLFQNTLRNPNQFAETLARLAALVGAENIGTPVLEATHRPDAFRLQPPNFEFTPAHHSKQTIQNEGMPLRRFRPPLPAQFEFDETKPVRISCNIFSGMITEIRGPFLSSGNWWDENRWAREEWDVETFGGPLLRLFRSGEGCYVEGVYD